MLAFAIYINEKKHCTVGLNEPGVVTTNLTWVRGEVIEKTTHDDLGLIVGGLVSSTETHLKWLQKQLNVGDVVKIEIVDSEDISKPKSKKIESPEKRIKQEKAYVRMMAKKFGWEIKKIEK